MNRDDVGRLLIGGVILYALYQLTQNQTLFPLDTTDNTDLTDNGTDTTAMPTQTTGSYADVTNDQDIVARTIYGEARGEIYEGQVAVGNVIMNRADDPQNRWPKDAASVCLQPAQFSCWNSNDPNYSVVNSDLATIDPTGYNQAMTIAAGVLGGGQPDYTDGAQFYFNPAQANPSWAATLQKTVTIGHHVFYRYPIGIA